MRPRRRAHRHARRAAQTRKTAAPGRSPRARTEAGAIPAVLLKTIVCGAAFVILVALKLLLPGNLAAVRGTVGSWLVRDADFDSAFSAVGRAVSGENGVTEALEQAYVAVFGEQKAKEVSGAAEVAAEQTEETEVREQAAETQPQEVREYPEHAVAAQRVLGFSYAPPLSGEVTSSFGWREHPTTGRETFHYGVDIAAEEGAEIRCFADGTVGAVGESTELGKYLTVHHANGVSTLYAHCSAISVTSGAAVARGEKLASAGSTGNATGTHLHFEIHDGEDYLDPIYYLS